jgi:phosphoribosylformylglycinamidine synthase
MALDAVVAIQDMGAAGLTCSAVEMGAKGDLGIELDLDQVPCREAGMTAYEMMLSESQERMLMVLKPAKKDEAHAVFRKWGLDFAIVGRTIAEPRFIVRHRGDVVADLPIRELGDQAPDYDRPWTTTTPREPLPAPSIPPPGELRGAILKLIGSPDLASRRWVWEQYDHFILSNTAQMPGGDAGVVRLGDGLKALAATVDVTPRYVEANPYEGGKQAVAECWRNLTAVGADPVAVTDNLNFGNPERPEIMGQLVLAVQGIAEACRELAFPVVSGNVSLYNETNGRAILPCPAIGGVGCIPDWRLMTTIAFKNELDCIVLIGGHGSHLGQTLYLREIAGREDGPPPPVDLSRERRNGNFIRNLIRAGRLTACHDISDGGLLIAIAEMALAGNRGAILRLQLKSPHIALFAEDQSRYVVTCRAPDAPRLCTEAQALSVPAQVIGEVVGSALIVDADLSISLDELRRAHEGWFPALMSA